MITAELTLPDINPVCKKYGEADLLDMCRWPEFLALANRLGIDMSRPYRRMVIDVQIGCEVVILLQQIGADNGGE